MQGADSRAGNTGKLPKIYATFPVKQLKKSNSFHLAAAQLVEQIQLDKDIRILT